VSVPEASEGPVVEPLSAAPPVVASPPVTAASEPSPDASVPVVVVNEESTPDTDALAPASVASELIGAMQSRMATPSSATSATTQVRYFLNLSI
jgi:hypothetical protein